MQGLTRFTIFLCCAWALTVLYGEMGAYWIPLWSCSWPQPPSNSSVISRYEREFGARNYNFSAGWWSLLLLTLKLLTGLCKEHKHPCLGSS